MGCKRRSLATHDEDELDDELDPPKATREARRLEAEAFAELAHRLAKGTPTVLPDPPFGEVLREAIVGARTMVKSAKTRQLRRLARLLREAAPLEEFNAALEHRSPAMLQERAAEQHNEQWRARLLQEGDPALDELVDRHPRADRALLRQLIRAARTDPPDARSKKAATRLLREIRALTRDES